MASELDDAIRGSYRVFERYPLRPSTEPRLHCHDPGEESVLHEHPWRAHCPAAQWFRRRGTDGLGDAQKALRVILATAVLGAIGATVGLSSGFPWL